MPTQLALFSAGGSGVALAGRNMAEITLESLQDQIESLSKRFDRFTATYYGIMEIMDRLEALEAVGKNEQTS